jgi:hypothetical protein
LLCENACLHRSEQANDKKKLYTVFPGVSIVSFVRCFMGRHGRAFSRLKNNENEDEKFKNIADDVVQFELINVETFLDFYMIICLTLLMKDMCDVSHKSYVTQKHDTFIND